MFEKHVVVNLLGAHTQKHERSCFPSAIEMVLKLEASRSHPRLLSILPSLSLQDEYHNCFSEECFIRDHGYGLGEAVVQKHTIHPPMAFKKSRLIRSIDEELDANRVVIVETGWRRSDGIAIHAWVVYKRDMYENAKRYWLVTGSYGNPIPLEYKEFSEDGLYLAMLESGKLCYWTYDLI